MSDADLALIDGIRKRDRAALGRAITLIESRRADHRDQAHALLTALMPHTGGAVRVGLSGVPGAGKSTFIEAFGMMLIEQGHRVAVLSIDPSSRVSGGSILGDKTRMARLSRSDQAFIRPSPTGNTLGGVAARTREAMTILDAAGFDVIIVETVGVGQSETTVADMVDVFLVLMLAGTGDDLQGIKRGILEVADILSVNKADGDNETRAVTAANELRQALKILRGGERGTWAPVVRTTSGQTGAGLEQIWQDIEACVSARRDSGELDERRQRQRRDWMWSIVEQEVLGKLRNDPVVAALRASLEPRVAAGEIPATAAAQQLLAAFEVAASGAAS
ncbi:MAG: methylmalonyl Co-A mutase-associated GTPase MeaB [Candidatus Dadabacteria bacterium]|nr:MAG: methylmalonyl Co-A mutase-associated GTPase MeaB [Candidatus Dadabacteria bacterium]